MLFFFRDPERELDVISEILFSPADGQVIANDVMCFEPGLENSPNHLAIYLSIFNVHVVRSPAHGTIKRIQNIPGSFLPAGHKKAFKVNYKTLIELETIDGILLIVLTAGILVRRTTCYVRPGDTVSQGQKLGLVRFGSRADIFAPNEFAITLRLGDKTVGGKTAVAQKVSVVEKTV